MDQQENGVTESSVSAAVSSDEKPVEKTAEKSIFDWGTIAVGGVSAVAGILGTPYGVYVGGGIAILVAIAAFMAKQAFNDWKYKSDLARAGAEAGSEASSSQEKINRNRDRVDDFFGRDRRS